MTTATPSPVRKVRFRLANVEARRADTEGLLEKASLLPPLEATLMAAHLNAGLSATELAVLHNTTPRQMRLRLDRLRQTLADPCFILASRYAGKLPAELQSLAHAYWIEGRSLRDLALRHAQTLHRIRRQITLARSLLLVAFSAEHPLSKDQALMIFNRRP